MSFNKVILIGNLGRDPELRYTAQGTPVCSFSIATNERRKDRNGEMQDHTTWFRVTLWQKRAETASQYLTKGMPVYIEGRLRVEEYSDRDGKVRHSLEVEGTEMQLIGSRRQEEDQINELKNLKHFGEQANTVKKLGFSLFVKRARIGQSKHVRVRPRFDQWATEGRVAILDESITPKILQTILDMAGRYKGMGDWRPSSKTPGQFGMFEATVTG